MTYTILQPDYQLIVNLCTWACGKLIIKQLCHWVTGHRWLHSWKMDGHRDRSKCGVNRKVFVLTGNRITFNHSAYNTSVDWAILTHNSGLLIGLIILTSVRVTILKRIPHTFTLFENTVLKSRLHHLFLHEKRKGYKRYYVGGILGKEHVGKCVIQ
jgi:hypothetical protein